MLQNATVATGKICSLEIKRLQVAYRSSNHNIQALDNVSLQMQPGTCTALIGESGSGKSTLASSCLQLLPDNADVAGDIFINKTSIRDLSEKEMNGIRWSEIAIVFQNGIKNLNPLHKIIDQVAEPVICRQEVQKEQALEQAGRLLSHCRVQEELYSKYPHQLSGGEIQRVLLAMALILDPGVIILDEPTSGLDCITKSFIASILRELKAKGKTVLLITHDIEFAAAIADTVAVLYLGQIMEIFPGENLLKKSLHPYTWALIRSVALMDRTNELGGIRGEAFYRFFHRHENDESGHVHIHTQDVKHSLQHGPVQGCLFFNRCTQAREACKKEAIGLKSIDDHQVRCLRGGIADIVTLDGVSKKYSQKQAVYPVQFSIKMGEVLTIIGETGSGKTTLAMLCACVLPSDTGTVYFDGNPLESCGKKQSKLFSKKIGILYQNPLDSVSPYMSVYDIVAEPVIIYKEEKNKTIIRSRVRDMLADVQCPSNDEFLRMYPHQLNMGALQRICLARALIMDPQLIIADEPTSSLDPSLQAKIMKLLLQKQTERGISLLCVTHNIGIAAKISNRIAVMYAGGIVEMGYSRDIIFNPLHPYTKRLIENAKNPLLYDFCTIEDSLNISCSFVHHCSRSKEICLQQKPPLVTKKFRRIACHFADNGC